MEHPSIARFDDTLDMLETWDGRDLGHLAIGVALSECIAESATEHLARLSELPKPQGLLRWMQLGALGSKVLGTLIEQTHQDDRRELAQLAARMQNVVVELAKQSSKSLVQEVQS